LVSTLLISESRNAKSSKLGDAGSLGLDDEISQAILAGLAGWRFDGTPFILRSEKNESDMVAAQFTLGRTIDAVSANFGVKRNGKMLARDGIKRANRAAPIQRLLNRRAP
jgi:hypothetical protein